MAAELKETELEQLAMSWPERAQAIRITDQRSYDEATDLLVGIANLKKQIMDHHAPIKKAAHDAHKAVVSAENRMLDPLVRADGILRSGISAFTREQARLAAVAHAKAEEEARLEEENQRLALAIQAKEHGAPEETVVKILDTPMPVAPVVVPQAYMQARGVGTVERWAAEVFDLKLLCMAVASNKASIELIQPNMQALNQMARAMKSTMNIPGVRAVAQTGITVRR